MPALKYFLLFFLITTTLFPQDRTNIPFLNVPVSPQINAAGSAGTALLNDDPYGFLFNPAHLGFNAKNPEISLGFYPQRIDWLKRFTMKNSYLNSFAINVGYNFEKVLNGIPLSIGIGYARSEINYSLYLRENSVETYSDYGDVDNYDIYSLGVLYSSVVNISAGLSVKNIRSVFGDVYGTVNPINPSVNVTAMDYGLLINLPLNNLLRKLVTFDIPSVGIFMPDLNYTFGYSIKNIGDRTYYFDKQHAAPLPRTASLGHSIQFNINFDSKHYQSQILKIVYSINSDDILVKINGDSVNETRDYQGLAGDIKPFKNLFMARADPEVILHKGFTLEVFEALSYSCGSVSKTNKYNYLTNGYGVKLKGILKLINIPLQNNIISYLTDHIDIQYSQSEYNLTRHLKCKFEGITIRIKGLY